jgi:hypothetical protein
MGPPSLCLLSPNNQWHLYNVSIGKTSACLLWLETIHEDYFHGRVICRPTLVFQSPPWLLRFTFPISLFFAPSLLLHAFFLSIDIGTVLQTTRSLYNDHKQRTQGKSLLLTSLSIFALPWPTLTFCIIAPFFLRWLNGMAVEIGSPAAGLELYVVRLGIGRKEWRKAGRNPPNLF